jgi:hypothetical protein
MKRLIATLGVAVLLPLGATAQSADELAEAAANPIADLISVPLQLNNDFGLGEFDRTRNVLNIQPVVPRVPALETENVTRNDFKPSEYLNYLGPSIELNLGDVVPWDPLADLWLGHTIHHRSAVFTTAQQFGRIKGGSNYPGVSLTWHR